MYAPAVNEAFLAEVSSLPGGERITQCIQCGSCSGSCPTAAWMDHSPRQIFALIRCGMRDEVLSSNTPWTCASCYTCYVRCPKEIKITDIMYALKRLSIREHKAKPETKPARVMAEVFEGLVNKHGRNSEFHLMRRLYGRPSAITKALRNAPSGMKLKRLGRLPFRQEKLSANGLMQMKQITDAVEKMGGL
ncbi:MAG: 4Fe-4S dicluster domain-containing protein [Verrucomicrobia bacterium]|nr:4Fe-4S dicluster domain-containing protein [Verrucomicrobiota bacterium]